MKSKKAWFCLITVEWSIGCQRRFCLFMSDRSLCHHGREEIRSQFSS